MLLNTVTSLSVIDYAETNKNFAFISQFFQKDENMYKSLKWKSALQYGEDVGFIGYKIVDNTAVISVFCISKSLRGEGLGTIMLKEFETFLESQNITKISLMAFDEKAANFWQKNSFIKEDIPGIEMFYKNIEEN